MICQFARKKLRALAQHAVMEVWLGDGACIHKKGCTGQQPVQSGMLYVVPFLRIKRDELSAAHAKQGYQQAEQRSQQEK